ncbi:hydrolase [Peribacillus sp. FSL E2-0218]|uniref:hydrolase n=1 Tax=Peribacillus sp. FSL E2-0218 TaxID=2921364 RepID=UPI0030EBF06B
MNVSENRKKYYIWLPTGEITQDRESSPWNFEIEATDNEVIQLRELFDYNYSVGEENFYRAHVPYLQYHFDRENDKQDITLQKIFEMIHQLGTEEGRRHIESMGILQAKPTDDGLEY